MGEAEDDEDHEGPKSVGGGARLGLDQNTTGHGHRTT